jgi:hypothetical protein
MSFVLVTALAACGGGGGRTAGPSAGPGASAPAAAVERFLRLVQTKSYLEMGQVFGTREGPIAARDPAGEVERRMYAVASILEHQRFTIRDEGPIPGRTGEAYRLAVALENRGRTSQVPFTVVRGPNGLWFVEQVDLEAVTRDR